MSIELKIRHKEKFNNESDIKNKINDNEQEQEEELRIKMKKMLGQKYKIDIIDAFGANTKEDIDNPVNIITNNNYIIYNVGHHILIKDFPGNENEMLSEKEINKQSNIFFIYLSPYSKTITSLSVS